MSGIVQPYPLFLPAARGRLFATLFGAAEPSREAVLLLPPFAEEMNKCRPMLAAQARALAQLGTDVLLLDLFGTGDSEGDFAAARWDGWVDDLRAACAWLRDRGAATVHLWAVRSGALFLSELTTNVDPAQSRVILWHPAANGRQTATQWLRMRIAADSARGRAQTTDSLRRELREAGSLEIAGYEISQPLLEALEARTLEAGLIVGWKHVCWLDVVSAPAAEPLPATARILESARGKAARIEHDNVVGEPFWGTPEIARIPALVEATCRLYSAKPH